MWRKSHQRELGRHVSTMCHAARRARVSISLVFSSYKGVFFYVRSARSTRFLLYSHTPFCFFGCTFYVGRACTGYTVLFFIHMEHQVLSFGPGFWVYFFTFGVDGVHDFFLYSHRSLRFNLWVYFLRSECTEYTRTGLFFWCIFLRSACTEYTVLFFIHIEG